MKTKVNTEEKSVLQGNNDGFAVDLCSVAHGSFLGYKKEGISIPSRIRQRHEE